MDQTANFGPFYLHEDANVAVAYRYIL